MTIPRPDARSKAFFESILPDDPRIQVRPMFGNIAAFVNGNMFIGLYGNDVFIRLSERDRAELLVEKDTSLFEPMKGRPMKEYVMIPKTWRADLSTVSSWAARSLNWVGKMPTKEKKILKEKREH